MGRDFDIQSFISRIIKVRDKARKNPTKENKALFEAILEDCLREFDPLIKDKIKRYKNFSNYEDLYQDAKLALVMAINSYNPKKVKNIRKDTINLFYWWIGKYIKTKISREANRHSTIKIPIKYSRVIQPYKVSQLPIMVDCALIPSEQMSSIETQNQLYNAINSLPELQKKVVMLHFDFEKQSKSSIADISELLNVSKSNVLKILDDAKKTLRTQLLQNQ